MTCSVASALAASSKVKGFSDCELRQVAVCLVDVGSRPLGNELLETVPIVGDLAVCLHSSAGLCEHALHSTPWCAAQALLVVLLIGCKPEVWFIACCEGVLHALAPLIHSTLDSKASATICVQLCTQSFRHTGGSAKLLCHADYTGL